MNSELLKKHIAVSFKSLIQTSSFKKITVKELCEEANISRRSFYYHFSDKYDLMKWIYQSEIKEFDILHPKPLFNEYIWNRYYVNCQYLHSQKDYYIRILADSSQNSFYQLMLEILTEPLNKSFGNFYTPKTQGHKLLTTLVIFYFQEVYEWLKDDHQESAEDFCRKSKESAEQLGYVLAVKGLHIF